MNNASPAPSASDRVAQEPVADRIYIGSIALEPNRWVAGRTPSYRVSTWLDAFRAAGFDGVELWENHAPETDEQERLALRSGPLPISIFNTYAGFTNDSAAQFRHAAELGTTLQAAGYKFNLGADPARRDEYVRNAVAWRSLLPAAARVLCECHPGTIMETPAAAARIFESWPERQFQAIVHPLLKDTKTLSAWFEHLGERITHAHMQLRDEQDRFIRLDRRPDKVRDALEIMDAHGFKGSFTIEFTGGTRAADETIDLLWENARRDLETLRLLLAEVRGA